MIVTVVVNLEDIIGWILLGIGILILLAGWIFVGIVNVFDWLTKGHRERKRQKMYDEYDRKYGNGGKQDDKA